MDIENFMEYLDTQGFELVPVNVKEIKVLFKRDSEDAYVINIIDYYLGVHMDRNKFNEIIDTIKESFEKLAFRNVFIHTVIFTKRIEDVKDFAQDDFSHWIYDTEKHHLVIFENQPDEFLGCRWYLEGSPVAGVQEIRYNKYFTPITVMLILINVVIFGILEVIGDTTHVKLLVDYGAFVNTNIMEGEWYRLFTAVFLHQGMGHLFNNMLTLFVVGNYVERTVGKWKYIVIYLGAGIIGNIVTLIYYGTDALYISVGASGAIFGVIGALTCLVIMNRGRLEDISVVEIIIMLGLALNSGFTGENVNNVAHVSGALAGIVIASIVHPKRTMNPMGWD